MSGLARNTVIFEPYDSSWADEFAREKALVQPIFGKHKVFHTGSTSVPGLAAKPIIDMLVGLDSLTEFEQYRAQLETLGYVNMPDREKAWEIFIPKGPDDARTHYLHVMVTGSPEYRAVLAFRDYLRTHDDMCDKYAALKRDLAARYSRDRPSYTAEKSDFILATIRQAQHRPSTQR